MILESLPGSDDGEVSDWLLETSDWVGANPLKLDERTDILSVFLSEINRLREQGLLGADDSYDNAVKFVEELMKRREALSP